MKRIWAPWRMAYILGPKKTGCIFCFDPSEDDSRHVLRRTERAFCMLNRYPYTNGHLLVVPRAHVSRPQDLSQQDFAAWNELVRESLSALQQAIKPDGFNVGMNLGKVAGAGVEEHLHYHIVPRWAGDHNYMAVLGEVRMINQHLQETFEQLKPAFHS